MNLENLTQIERYKNLIQFIDKVFKENIDIGKIQEYDIKYPEVKKYLIKIGK
jgi:hypothetical protein